MRMKMRMRMRTMMITRTMKSTPMVLMKATMAMREIKMGWLQILTMTLMRITGP